jgi:ferritin
MASWFRSQNLNGFANWMQIQVKEEMDHAAKFYNFLHDCGADVVFDAIPKPRTVWETAEDAFNHTLEHEGMVTSRINNLIDLALSEKDHATNARLQWFINEQVEEEATVLGILQQIKLINSNPNALFMLDRELAKRVYTSPASGE